jgi:hypothetical protein
LKNASPLPELITPAAAKTESAPGAPPRGGEDRTSPREVLFQHEFSFSLFCASQPGEAGIEHGNVFGGGLASGARSSWKVGAASCGSS